MVCVPEIPSQMQRKTPKGMLCLTYPRAARSLKSPLPSPGTHEAVTWYLHRCPWKRPRRETNPLTDRLSSTCKSAWQKRFLVGCGSSFMQFVEHLTLLFALGASNVCLVGEHPACSLPALYLQGCEGLWSNDYDHAQCRVPLPPTPPSLSSAVRSVPAL